MFKRGDVWWTKIRHKGKVYQKSLETENKRIAQNIEAKIRSEIVEGKYFEKPKGDNLTVAELIEKYLAEHSKPNKKKRVFQDDVYLSKKILQHFGKKNLTEVNSSNIFKFITARRKDGVKMVTIHHELRLLRHSYKLAINPWLLLNKSPFEGVEIPKGDVERKRYLSEDEEGRLLKILPNWLLPIVTIARETGLRLSNIINLKWCQINLVSKVVTIEKDTKNGDPIMVPMTDNVFAFLKSFDAIRVVDGEYVFGKEGKPFTRWWVSQSFKKYCVKADINDFRFHDLRHDFCSKLVQKGVDIYQVATLAGHRDLKSTKRYSHLNPESLRVAVASLNNGYNLATGISSKEGQNL